MGQTSFKFPSNLLQTTLKQPKRPKYRAVVFKIKGLSLYFGSLSVNWFTWGSNFFLFSLIFHCIWKSSNGQIRVFGIVDRGDLVDLNDPNIPMFSLELYWKSIEIEGKPQQIRPTIPRSLYSPFIHRTLSSIHSFFTVKTRAYGAKLSSFT